MENRPGLARPSASDLCKYKAIIYIPGPYLRHAELPIAILKKLEIMARLLESKLKIAFASTNRLNYTVVHSPDANSKTMAEILCKKLDGFTAIKEGQFDTDEAVEKGMTQEYILGLAAKDQVLVLVYPAWSFFMSRIIGEGFEGPKDTSPHEGDAAVIFPSAELVKILRKDGF